MGENEYYAAEKVARKVISEELEKCIKGNKHEIEIENIKGEIEDMKKVNENIFSQIRSINGKFLTIAGAIIAELITLIYFIITIKSGV